MNNRIRGTVKRWYSEKGWGFVKRDDGNGKDCFAHYSSIQDGAGFRNLIEGEAVEFDVETGPKGPIARNITRVNSAPVNDIDWAPRTFGDYADDE